MSKYWPVKKTHSVEINHVINITVTELHKKHMWKIIYMIIHWIMKKTIQQTKDHNMNKTKKKLLDRLEFQ